MDSGDHPKTGAESTDASAERIRRVLLGAVAVGFLIVVVLSGASVWAVGRGQDYTHWVNHTYRVEREISRLNVLLTRSEISRRGYFLTREPQYLTAYREGITEAPKALEAIQTLTADNPRQQATVAELQRLITLSTESSDNAIRRGPMLSSAALASLLADDRKATGNPTVAGLAKMLAEENRLLAQRADRQGANESGLLILMLASSILLAALTLGSTLLVRRFAADLGRSQEALRSLNEGLERRVRERTDDLVRANEEIQRFAYIVSHDLRSPLVNVMGFTSELEVATASLKAMMAKVEAEAPSLLSRDAKAALSTDLPEAIGFIRSSTQKMDRLINAILKLSREGRRTLTPERIDLAELLRAIVASLTHQAQQRGAQVTIEDPLPGLTGDRLALEQVFSNLIENALKYLKPGRPGLVSVSGRAVDDRVVYEVRDNGRGIDPKDHSRIFDLFRRAGAQDQPGEGIGLAHVRALIYRLGGAIQVDSALDAGTTFRISLPRTSVADEEVPA